MEANLTANDLVEALREALAGNKGPDDARTCWELCKSMGLAEKAVRKRVRLAIEAGLVEAVVVTRTSMHGRPTTVPAYRIRS